MGQEQKEVATLFYKVSDIDLLCGVDLFVFNFYENNKNKFKLEIKDELMEFRVTYNINKDDVKKGFLKVKLFSTNKITNISSMFHQCDSLISVHDISNLDTSKITSFNNLFDGCTSLLSLSGVSEWNTSKVKEMSHMFSNCTSLKVLPDISKWDTSKVTDMSFLFHNCISLSYLPDITKWNVSNLNNATNMFSQCSSLIRLPDITKWNKDNLNIKDIFQNCHSLVYGPEISKLNSYFDNKANLPFLNCINCLNYNEGKYGSLEYISIEDEDELLD